MEFGELSYDGYTFEKDWELAPGPWVIQLLHQGMILGEKTFEVHDAELDDGIAEAVREEIERLKSEDCRQRLGAVRQLADMGPAAAATVLHLIQTLKYYSMPSQISFDCGSGKEAARALAEMGASAVDPLLESLRDSEWNVRAGASDALAMIGHQAVLGLVRVLRTSKDPRLRIEAVQTLGKIEDPRVIDTLVKTAQQEGPYEIRRHAIEILAQRRARDAVPALIRLFQSREESHRLRSDALNAVVKIIGAHESIESASLPVHAERILGHKRKQS